MSIIMHDTSLTRSVSKAVELEYTLEKINSELLATLLSEEIMREEFEEHKDKIDDFFSDLENEFDDLNEEED